MSISQNFPAVTPTLSLNFARSKTLDPRITFSRTSPATRVNGQGLIEVMSADEPRFDHSYENGVVKSLGLLVEESRITYQTYTEDPTQWTISNMVPTGNSVTLPTGVVSTTIEYKGETTNADNKFIRPTVFGSAITAGDTWVYSGFYKKGVTNGERYVHIVLQNNTASEGTGRRFDFDTGTWASTQSSYGGTTVDSGYEIYPNGWYRIWMKCTFPSASSAVQTFVRLFTNSTSIPYDTSFSLWGVQLEKASFMTSYIPNDTGSQKTRNQDNAYMTGENFLDWYNNNEFTVFTQHRFPQLRTDRFARVFEISIEGNTGYRINHYHNPLTSGTRVGASCIENNINQFAYTTGAYNIDDDIRIATRLKDNSFASYGNGTLFGSDNAGVFTTTQRNALYIGCDANQGSLLNGTIEQFIYYPKLLTNEQLQNLTK